MSFLDAIIIFTLSTLFADSRAAVNIYKSKFHAFQNWEVNGSSLGVLLQRSEVECGATCISDTLCYYALYRQSTKKCFLYDYNSSVQPQAAEHKSTVLIKGCPQLWRSHGTSCYRIFLSYKTWPDAQAECQRLGSKLVEIETEQEGVFVRQECINAADTAFWIGGTKKDTGYWHWSSSGEKFTYTDWGQGRPAISSARLYVDIINIPSMDYRWNNAEYYRRIPYICEISFV